SGSGVKIAEGMKKTAPDGAVSGMPAIRETGPGKNLQAITVSTQSLQFIEFVGRIRHLRRIRHEQSLLCLQSESGLSCPVYSLLPAVTTAIKSFHQLG
ncbi:hypothetical protein, partial [Escherichia coli]|uniref:hypothetical protein n=1 Tax=Escherichia coli TaxID=562 RepID=UPI000D0B461B